MLNRPSNSCPYLLFESVAKCESINMKMIFIPTQTKLIFTRTVLQLVTF